MPSSPAQGPNQSNKSNKRWANIANWYLSQTGKEVQSQQEANVRSKPKLKKEM